MCGRYKRRSDKQRIAEAFHVKAGLDETDFAAEDDIAPGSIQPVVRANDEGQRSLDAMYWGFKLPPDSCLTHALTLSSRTVCGKQHSRNGDVSFPLTPSLNGSAFTNETIPNTRSLSRAVNRSAWLASGAFGRIPRMGAYCPRLQSSPLSLMRVWLPYMTGSLPSLSRENMKSGWHHLNVPPCTCCVSCPQRRWTFG